jgi:hypothetical protein
MPASSFVYRNHDVDIRQVAQEFGFRYVLNGTVRRRQRATEDHRPTCRRRFKHAPLGRQFRWCPSRLLKNSTSFADEP